MKSKAKSLIGLLSISFVLLTSGVAMATITYEFYGTIDRVNKAGSGAFADIYTDNPFTYGLIVDETVADSNSSAIIGHYDAIIKMYLDINGLRYLEANAGQIVIANNDPYNSTYPYVDVFQPYINTASYFTLNNLGVDAYSSQLNLWQSSSGEPTVFSSDALPLFAPNPAVFDMSHGFIVYLGLGSDSHPSLHGNITGSAFSATVPEPSTMLLLGSGLLGLWGFKKKIRK